VDVRRSRERGAASSRAKGRREPDRGSAKPRDRGKRESRLVVGTCVGARVEGSALGDGRHLGSRMLRSRHGDRGGVGLGPSRAWAQRRRNKATRHAEARRATGVSEARSNASARGRNTPHRNKARGPLKRAGYREVSLSPDAPGKTGRSAGNRRGAGSRRQSDGKQKSVGRILRRPSR